MSTNCILTREKLIDHINILLIKDKKFDDSLRLF